MENRTCIKCSNNFSIDADEFSFYEKMKVPAPHVCPDCRFKMRAVWRNEVSLYSGQKCKMCDKSIISIFNPKSGYIVYCSNCYSSDRWDAKDYAKDYDYERPFFDQLKELTQKMPKSHLYITSGTGPMINSDYTNFVGGLKNCYLVFNSALVEDSAYSRGISSSKEVLDSYFCKNIDQCYEDINCHNSNKLFYSKNSTNCVDSYLLSSCSNLINCFGCVNLRNKSYCYFNEQLTKEEYNSKMESIIGSHKELEKEISKFKDFILQYPYKSGNNLNLVNSIGDYLFDCKNVKYSFEGGNGEDSRYIFSSRDFKDCYDILGYGIKGELLLNCVSVGFASRCIGSFLCENSQELEYSLFCKQSDKNLLGCDGLKNSQYCILNKQYSKEEYEKLREHIVKELTEQGLYGLMLPAELSPFAYNETIGQDNMPMTKDEAISQGFRWEDDIQMTKGKETIQLEEIPDNIKDVQDSITTEVFKCAHCERNYKITEQELFFYKRMNLPIPRICFYCRHQDRILRRGPIKFWDRSCDNCNKSITTNYAPDRPEIIYCEKCYQQEVM